MCAAVKVSMTRNNFALSFGSLVVITAASFYVRAAQSAPPQQEAAKPKSAATEPVSPQRAFLNQYCAGCHNQRLKSGGLALDALDLSHVGDNPVPWEAVVRKLRAGLMPPAGLPRPEEKTYDEFRMWVQSELDRSAATHPDPGRTEVFHRLNRAEYQNAVRDVLGVDINAADLLPADDSSNGFDNMAGALRMSQSLTERYISVAKAVGRMAVGNPPPAVDSKEFRLAPDLQQFNRIEELPFGTRGGTLIRYLFSRDADYDIKVEVTGVRDASEGHQLEVSIDGEQAKLFTITPKYAREPGGAYDTSGKFNARVHVNGGPHDVGVTFFRKPLDLVEQVREPFPNPRISGNTGGLGGAMPDIVGVTIVGPYNDAGPGDTPSRRKIFVCYPSAPSEEAVCARTILSKVAYRAYRGPVADDDLRVLVKFYEEGRAGGGNFDTGIEFALQRLLVSPAFLFRIEADPASAAASKKSPVMNAALDTPSIYPISDLELASRLSFFLWSSLPDDELLDAASKGKLKDPAVLAGQTKRMTEDARSQALTSNFAGQWLQLRNLDIARPGDPYSLAFDESLRNGLKRETEMFFDSIVRENRPVMELLTANYTFLNERVALHYGIPNVQGDKFRRVALDADSPRRGILGQGSILTITSRPNRTSPVLRGKWILGNILGTPPPDPPPNIPALDDKQTQAKTHTLREMMAAHRAQQPCAGCHSMIDPPGFALESFDAIGRLRAVDDSFNALDTSGVLPDGTKFKDVTELKAALTRRPERFANAMTEKLLTYALGRGLEYYDMPAVRKIVSEASPDYKFQSIILNIVKSYPFLMRRVDPPAGPKASGSVAGLQSNSSNQGRSDQ
jgi:mono/diheme cytochrome c family protein